MQFITKQKTQIAGLGILLGLGLSACDNGGSTPQAPASSNELTFQTQAAAGAVAFGANCAVCHGANLEGSTLAPLLTGPDFLRRWPY